MIDFWSEIITIVYFSTAYFHFFIIERKMSWWEKIYVANFLQKLAYRKNAGNGNEDINIVIVGDNMCGWKGAPDVTLQRYAQHTGRILLHIKNTFAYFCTL